MKTFFTWKYSWFVISLAISIIFATRKYISPHLGMDQKVFITTAYFCLFLYSFLHELYSHANKAKIIILSVLFAYLFLLPCYAFFSKITISPLNHFLFWFNVFLAVVGSFMIVALFIRLVLKMLKGEKVNISFIKEYCIYIPLLFIPVLYYNFL